jgi:hypothetical protein
MSQGSHFWEATDDRQPREPTLLHSCPCVQRALASKMRVDRRIRRLVASALAAHNIAGDIGVTAVKQAAEIPHRAPPPCAIG